MHSFVEFRDGSVLAQMSPPDMRAPIQYALTWPARLAGCAPALDWSTLRELRFEQVDHRFDARKPAVDNLAAAIKLEQSGGIGWTLRWPNRRHSSPAGTPSRLR